MDTKLRDILYNRFWVENLIFSPNSDELDNIYLDKERYVWFVFILISILESENLLYFKSGLGSHLKRIIGLGTIKWSNEEGNIVINTREVIKRFIDQDKSVNPNVKNEKVYYLIQEEKRDRSIPDNINISKQDFMNLRCRDLFNYDVLLDKNDEFDKLELFSFISTSFLICNNYSDLFDYNEIPYLKGKIEIISKYLYNNKQYDSRYIDVIDKYYKKLIDRLNNDLKNREICKKMK